MSTTVQWDIEEVQKAQAEINKWIEAHPDQKFTPEDVTDVFPHKIWAETWASQYTGSFEFMTQMVETLAEQGGLTWGQAKGVLNCYRADYLRAKSNDLTTRQIVVKFTEQEPIVDRPLLDGRYTVLFNGNESDYLTIRIQTVKAGGAMKVPEGTQIASYLVGPANDTDYQSFAFVMGSQISVWRRFRDESRPRRALEVLLAAGDEERDELGKSFAMKSGSCWRCGRTLTTPRSIELGIGPVCRGYLVAGEKL
jgi:hypothetical protein